MSRLAPVADGYSFVLAMSFFLRVGHRYSGKAYLLFCKQFLETSFLFGIGAFIIELL